MNKFNYNERSEVVEADMDGTTGYEDVYAFDDIGNRTTVIEDSGSPVTYVPDNLNQYDTVGGTTFVHDFDGNLTSDGKWSYVWNAENRLVSMESSASVPLADRQKLEFKYDFMGRRFEKKAYAYNDQLSTPGYELQTTTIFVYDGWNMIHEAITDNAADPDTSSAKSHIWGIDLSKTLQGAGGVDGLLATVISDGSTATYYPVCDVNGNITEYVNASGSVVARYKYDAFGKCTATESMAEDFSFRFSSKYEDTETSLNYYGFRYYSSGMGRWLSRDPISENGGINLTVAGANNLISNVDIIGATSFKTWVAQAILTFATALNGGDGGGGGYGNINGDAEGPTRPPTTIPGPGNGSDTNNVPVDAPNYTTNPEGVTIYQIFGATVTVCAVTAVVAIAAAELAVAAEVIGLVGVVESIVTTVTAGAVCCP